MKRRENSGTIETLFLLLQALEISLSSTIEALEVDRVTHGLGWHDK